MTSILVVDDEAAVRYTLREIITEEGWSVLSASSGEEALELLDQADLVVTDLAMPGMDGMALLGEVKRRRPALPVVMLTARGSERVAVSALKLGAYDYLTKPFDLDELVATLRRALELHTLRADLRKTRAEQALGTAFVAQSPAMKHLLAQVERLAERPLPVLVKGETGTGKELVGALLHTLGSRPGPLVRFNCAAMSEDLAASELFGHVKGAFTGATKAKEGFFARADQGTLILDEVGELPLSVQATLLRALQSGEIQPVGAARVRQVDVRVVACTHRDLRAEVEAGRFREDLYYRVAVVELRVPALRERREEIQALVDEFVRRYSQRFGLGAVTLTQALRDALEAASWPGNVRQLKNLVERVLILGDGTGPIEARELPGEEPNGEEDGPMALSPTISGLPLREAREAFEREYLLTQINRFGGNISRTANFVGMERSALHRKLKSLGVVTSAKAGVRVAHVDEEADA